MNIFRHQAFRGVWGLLSLGLTALFLFGCVIVYFELQLPNVDALNDVQLQVPLRIYTNDKKLIAVYGSERRNPVTLSQIPKPLIQAVLATEDNRFYEHEGVDFIGLVRAAVALITTGKKSQGASTITMQVARNFYLSPKKNLHAQIQRNPVGD